MKIATLNSHRYFLVFLAILFWHYPLRAQDVDEGEFYLNFTGSAIFPYTPKGQLDNPALKTGAGFAATFGYAFKEGVATEMEWGYQKASIGNPNGNFSQNIDGGSFMGFEGLPTSAITITSEIDGEIKTQSLMGNVYYRYPKWRVSPYAGFGLGAFFHDRTVTSTVTVENIGIGINPNISPYLDLFPLPGNLPPVFTGGTTTFTDEDSRFAYQLMGGLSARISQRVEFHFGYRFRSSWGGPIDSDQIESGIRFRF